MFYYCHISVVEKFALLVDENSEKFKDYLWNPLDNLYNKRSNNELKKCLSVMWQYIYIKWE